MVYTKTYLFNYFYEQYLVVFNTAPRNVYTWYLVLVRTLKNYLAVTFFRVG